MIKEALINRRDVLRTFLGARKKLLLKPEDVRSTSLRSDDQLIHRESPYVNLSIRFGDTLSNP